MKWKNEHRELLYEIIEEKWIKFDIDEFEKYLATLGIKWAELKHENHAPTGTIAVWEGTGEKDKNLKMCWVIPDDVAMRLLAIGAP